MAVRRYIALLLSLLALPAAVRAQHTDFGTELEGEYARSLWRGASLDVSEKLRFDHVSTHYDRSKTELVLQQSLLRRPLKLYDLKWRVGMGYSFINRFNDDRYFYENQYRLLVQTSLTYRYAHWRFSLRGRVQATFRDIERGHYKYSPKTVLRCRLSATYAFPDRPWRFAYHNEVFCRLNGPRGAFVDEVRNTVVATRILDSRSSLSLYARMMSECQVADPATFLCLGLSYSFE